MQPKDKNIKKRDEDYIYNLMDRIEEIRDEKQDEIKKKEKRICKLRRKIELQEKEIDSKNRIIRKLRGKIDKKQNYIEKLKKKIDLNFQNKLSN